MPIFREILRYISSVDLKSMLESQECGSLTEHLCGMHKALLSVSFSENKQIKKPQKNLCFLCNAFIGLCAIYFPLKLSLVSVHVDTINLGQRHNLGQKCMVTLGVSQRIRGRVAPGKCQITEDKMATVLVEEMRQGFGSNQFGPLNKSCRFIQLGTSSDLTKTGVKVGMVSYSQPKIPKTYLFLFNIVI